MNTNKHYIMVGLFMISTIIALIFIGIWLAFGLNTTPYNIYVAVFHEPVDGLNINSDVKFNGVGIGSVTEIKIDKSNPKNVNVMMKIEEGTPITNATFATLKAQGITGLSYIGLQVSKRSKTVELLSPTKEPPYPVIPTKLSLFSNITDQITTVSKNIGNMSSRVNSIISDSNVKKVNTILSNITNISSSIAKNNVNISQSLQHINKILANVAKGSANFSSLIQNINNTAKEIALTSQQLAEISTGINNTSIKALNQTLLPNINQALGNVNNISIQLDQLLKKINQNPSVLIRGLQPSQPGPGEL